MNSKEMKTLVSIPGESSHADQGALICDVLMLVIFLWNQLYYGLDMLFLIIPLALIGIYLGVFCVITETYCFTETALEIRHPIRKTVRIPYDTVFNFDATAHDAFMNLLQSNKVKLYHTVGQRKRLTICRPRDIMTFTDALKQKCPEFHAEDSKPNRLEIFFADKNKES